MSAKSASFIFAGLLLAACLPPSGNSDLAKNFDTSRKEIVTAFTGASVFNGNMFNERTLCISAAVIVACPSDPDETVDLAGAYITPPFGDAHTHHFDGPYTIDWHTALGLESGVFYAMNMTAPTEQVIKIRDRLSGPGNIDVSSSLGGITGPQSHPIEIYEALALGFRSYEDQLANQEIIYNSKLVADNAYFVVETEDSVREKMALLLSADPDHVKVYLRHSERYEEGWGKWGPGGGIDPKLLPIVAKLANEAGKRLAVATSTVTDYRESLKANAKNITHIQCYQDTEEDPTSPYYDLDTEDECLLSEKDARDAAKIGMSSTFVVTEWAKDRPAKLVDWEKQNIAILKAAGAPIVVAVESYGSTITEGLIAGVEKEFFSPAELLKIASMDTPAFIFPDRKIGCLDVGCEASFLAFSNNPLYDFNAIRNIAFRMKDGVPVDIRQD